MKISAIRKEFLNIFKKRRDSTRYGDNRDKSKNNKGNKNITEKEKPHWEFKDKLR